VVEGGTLLRCYTSQRGIEGSNPSSSASKSARLQDCRTNSEVKQRAEISPGPVYTNHYTNAARKGFSGQCSLHRSSGLIPHDRQDVTVAIQRHGHRRVA
jgi:hypothetical protein